MPTSISHAAVGFAIGAWSDPAATSPRLRIAAALCAALPDVDVLSFPLDAGQTSLFSHRAITHSLAFTAIAAVAVAALVVRDPAAAGRRARVALVLVLALLSHSCLDALSTYAAGIEFLAPFSTQRFRFLWTPLGNPAGDLPRQLLQEALVVLLPALLLGAAAVAVGRRRLGPRPEPV